jgi:transposase/IS5 family transposase
MDSMSNFRAVDRGTAYLLPPSVDEWLPADHLARFVVEIVEQLDFSSLTLQYRGAGTEAYHPQMLAAVLLYGYASGTYSSRKIEQACYDSVAFRYIAANTHPDHDTLCAFRRRFLPQLQGLFVQVLQIARQMKLLKLGTIALDGTKVHANASRHNALSHARASQLEEQLKREVAELLRRAEHTDKAEEKAPLDIPAELARRETRLTAIAEAKAEIERRAAERLSRERAEYEARLAAREQKAKDSGKRPGGKPPQPPSAGVRPTDQVNLTDPESRIMPRSGGGGFDQSYNAHAAVDTDSMLIVATRLLDTPADARQVAPMIEQLKRLPEPLGSPDTLLADAGFYSAANVQHCQAAQIQPLIARRRDQHYLPWYERLTEPAPLAESADAVERMLHRLKTPAGRALYGLRKQSVEPVFGIIKQAMRFRQFLLRGKAKVTGEWQLVSLAYNLKRMQTLAAA